MSEKKISGDIGLKYRNNFDLLRLFASVQVLWGHVISHLEIKHSIFDFISNIFAPFPGVLIFFTISGFLITWSLDRNKDIIVFFKNRILRVFPALWLVSILTLILIFLTSVSENKTLNYFDLVLWLISQITVFQFWTPDSLRTWGVGNPNGSLWTLTVEFQFYITLPFVIFCFRRSKFKLILIVLLLTFSIVMNNIIGIYYKTYSHLILVKLANVSLLPYFYNFLIGSVFYLYWDKLYKLVTDKFWFWLIFFLAFCFFLNSGPRYYPNLGQLLLNVVLGILTISFAFTNFNCFNILRGNDISYGLYIFHMPVINFFVSLNLVGEINYLLSALVLILVMSVLSWLFVEKQVLKLKQVYQKKLS